MSSTKYIESLWKLKIKQMEKKTRKEYDENSTLFFQDVALQFVFHGYDIGHPQTDGGSLSEDYIRGRDLYVKRTLPNAIQIVDYLDFMDLLDYLRFFTHNTIDSSVDYGRGLARDSHRKHKTRMNGEPLPIYPPARIETLPIVKVDLPKDTDVKEDDNGKSRSKKPSNIF